jgi:hypothetical protein
MNQKLEYSMERQQNWYVDTVNRETKNLDDLVSEVFKTIPANSVLKNLELDQQARALISQAIEGIFHAVILDYADIFSERVDVPKLSDEEDDLELGLIETLSANPKKMRSEEFAKICQSVFNRAGIVLELAANGTPLHLKKSIAQQVVKEVTLAATNIIKTHRGDYLCKIAKNCQHRDDLVGH